MDVYLDNAASTPMLPSVMKAMQPFFAQCSGNPSSPHRLGEEAAQAMQKARAALAHTIGAKPGEIVFTSGGTEANNLALFGLAAANKESQSQQAAGYSLSLKLGKRSKLRGMTPSLSNQGKRKIVISAIEHSSVWEPAEVLKRGGFNVVVVPVTSEGIIDAAALEQALDVKTLLVSVLHANNEIGVIQNIAHIGALCRKQGVYFHTDAVQSFGKLAIDVMRDRIDFLTASGHKFGGPKGVGLLYVRSGVPLQPLLVGGGQERGARAGTENVAGIVGFAAAVEAAQRVSAAAVRKSRDALLRELEKRGGVLNGAREQRIYTNINVSFPGVDAELLVQKLSQASVYCSTRSACLSKQQKENRVLQALGLPRARQESSIRITLAKPLTNAEMRHAVEAFREALGKLV